jgi:hypothetical protein
MSERDSFLSEFEFRKLSSVDPDAVGDGLLSVSSRQYRQFADEWKSLAHTSSSAQARELAQKMVNIWLEAAVLCEAGLSVSRNEE